MDDLWGDAPWIRDELDAVRRLLDRELAAVPPELAGFLSCVRAPDGKMLRPAFLILSSRFGRPDSERIRRIAAAVEGFHLATLIHDDVIDDSATRRRRPTLYATRGARAAVLVGDFLFSRSLLMASAGADSPGIEHSSHAPSFRHLSSVVAHICASEIAQSRDSFQPSTRIRRYRRRIAGKTAALFAASFQIGASESGCSAATCQILRRIGYNIGMAFQIVDDILDLSGDASRLGKPVGQDLREGVYTLPVVYALRADAGIEALLRRLERRAAARAVRSAIEAIRSAGGIDAARTDARRYTDRALREIALLPENPDRHLLEATARALLSRTV